MVTETIPAHSVSIEPSLKDVVAVTVRPFFWQTHTNPDIIIGLIGDRGSGKTTGGVFLALKDFVFRGFKLFSNMDIHAGVSVPDVLSQAMINKPGGIVSYKSGHINKQQFLSLDGRYDGSCLFFDELNLEYGESRKSMTNVNLAVDTSVQQLRKMECPLVYTVLNEAYVDVRIRENTDIFIRCHDVAHKPQNMIQRMIPGAVYEWTIYPMSARVAGVNNTYADTGKPWGPIRITLRDMWETFDTHEKQAKGNKKYSEYMNEKGIIPLDVSEDPETLRYRDTWGWLDERLDKFLKRHKQDGKEIVVTSQEFAHELGVSKNQWGPVVRQIENRIPGIENSGQGWERRKYYIPNEFKTRDGKTVRELVEV